MTSQEETRVGAADETAAARGGGAAMWIIGVARFMVVLDGTIMFVALPTIQRSLHLTAANLNWVVGAYALMFGGLMLVAGRVGDLLGRKAVFRVGLVLFGLASLAGGLSPNGTALIFLRGLQGVGAAIATPGALSLLVSTFRDDKSRNKALGLYGGMTGMASVAGLILGGVLTTYLSWRAVLFVNVPIAAVVLLGVGLLSEDEPAHGKIDLPGAVSATLGVGALVFAVNRVNVTGWNDPVVIGCLVASAVLLAVFTVLQRTSAAPMIPKGVLGEPGRVGANIVTVLAYAGSYSTYYFLTLYMQQVLAYSALRAGLMYLPLAIGFGLAAGLGPKLLERTSGRIALTSGLLLAAVGALWFTYLTPTSSIFAVLIPASLITGIGCGLTAVLATAIGVRGIESSEAGVGSALLTAGGQIGGALGLAGLATVATSAVSHAALGTPLKTALTNGYTTGFGAIVGLYIAGIIVTLIFVKPFVQGQVAVPEPA